MAFKPNRELLNVNFEGYKLSSSTISCTSCALVGEVHQAKLKEGDFSYQHVRAFSLHNHLIIDPWDDNSVYWCNRDGSVQKGTYSTSPAAVSVSQVYSTTPADSCSIPSLMVVSPHLCLHCNGWELTLLYTGRSSSEWELIETFPLTSVCPMTLATASLIPDRSSILLLVAELHNPSPTLDRSERVKPSIARYTWYSIKFTCSLETVQSSPEAVRNSLNEISKITSFDSKSLSLYTAFQSHPTDPTHYLLFMSETTPTLTSTVTSEDSKTTSKNITTASKDSGNRSERDQLTTGVNTDSDPHFGLGYTTQDYNWTQTDSEVVMRVALPAGVTKRDIYCIITRQELVVGLTDGTTFFRGELFATVDTEGSTWTMEKDELEVTLEKQETGVQWTSLQKGVTQSGGGDQTTLTEQLIVNGGPGKNDPMPAVKRPRPLVSGELEECDITEEDITLHIISAQGELISKASLSGRQLIFTAPSQPGHAHYFALRHDVDTVVWLPSPTTHPSLKDPSWHHVNTFNALGYVQASKANKKFTTAPPNLKFAVITDCNRHIFVYVQPETGVKGDRAHEFVHTLPEKMDILGVGATNGGLVFVLTVGTLFVLKIPL